MVYTHSRLAQPPAAVGSKTFNSSITTSARCDSSLLNLIVREQVAVRVLTISDVSPPCLFSHHLGTLHRQVYVNTEARVV